MKPVFGLRAGRRQATMLALIALVFAAGTMLAEGQASGRYPDLTRDHTSASAVFVDVSFVCGDPSDAARNAAPERSLQTVAGGAPVDNAVTNLRTQYTRERTEAAADQTVGTPGAYGDSPGAPTRAVFVDIDLLRIWWAVSAMLVILMQLGFVYLEMGSVQERHRPGIAVKNFMILLCAFLAYYLVGYHLMFGDDVGIHLVTGDDIGIHAVTGDGVDNHNVSEEHRLDGIVGWGWSYPPTTAGGLTHAYEWLLFQAGFAAVAATIISGALACRTTLISNVLIALLICTVIYPVFGHWVWGGGLFGADDATFKVHDYAGSAVVHFLGGFSALVAAWIAGPRKEFPAPSHDRSLPWATIGVIFLWIGWIGFNGGSVTQDMIMEGGYKQVGNAILTTCLAACAGGLMALILAAWFHFSIGRAKGSPSIWLAWRQRLLFDPFATLSGAMGGMVAVTANCDWLIYDQYVAISVGVCGGVATFFTAWLVRDILRVDDPVEAIAVHAGGGAMGTMIAGFYYEATFSGQFVALVSCVMLVMVVLCPPLLLLRRLGLLRCSSAEEAVGLTFEQGLGPALIERPEATEA